jgi:hypothetical protein
MKGQPTNKTFQNYALWLQNSPFSASCGLLMTGSLSLLIPETTGWFGLFIQSFLFFLIMVTLSFLTFKEPEKTLCPPLCALLLPWVIHYISNEHSGSLLIMVYFIAGWLSTFLLVRFKSWGIVIESISVISIITSVLLSSTMPFFNISILFLLGILLIAKKIHESVNPIGLAIDFTDLRISYFYTLFCLLCILYFSLNPLHYKNINPLFIYVFLSYLIFLPYALSATALIHRATYTNSNRSVVLTLFYLTWILLFTIFSSILFLFGLSDTFIDYRKRFPKTFPKRQKKAH